MLNQWSYPHSTQQRKRCSGSVDDWCVGNRRRRRGVGGTVRYGTRRDTGGYGCGCGGSSGGSTSERGNGVGDGV